MLQTAHMRFIPMVTPLIRHWFLYFVRMRQCASLIRSRQIRPLVIGRVVTWTSFLFLGTQEHSGPSIFCQDYIEAVQRGCGALSVIRSSIKALAIES